MLPEGEYFVELSRCAGIRICADRLHIEQLPPALGARAAIRFKAFAIKTPALANSKGGELDDPLAALPDRQLSPPLLNRRLFGFLRPNIFQEIRIQLFLLAERQSSLVRRWRNATRLLGGAILMSC
jgi:hypothetical protein